MEPDQTIARVGKRRSRNRKTDERRSAGACLHVSVTSLRAARKGGFFLPQIQNVREVRNGHSGRRIEQDGGVEYTEGL